MRYVFGVVLIGQIFASLAYADIPCPPMPGDISKITRDVKSDIDAKVGSLGVVKVGEIGVKTEVAAKSIFEKWPNVDALLKLQTMTATYCAMIRDSKLPDEEKIDRWEKFQDKVLDLQSKQAAPRVGKVQSNSSSSQEADRTNSRSAEEKNAFETATALHTGDAYRTFLQMFPYGAFAKAVKLRLNACSTRQVSKSEIQHTELSKNGFEVSPIQYAACSRAKKCAERRLQDDCDRDGARLSDIQYRNEKWSNIDNGCEVSGIATCTWTKTIASTVEVCP